jgi:uncharacterized membrane protein
MNMRKIKEAQLRELLFRISVLLKGLDAALEIAGGIALWVVSPGLIIRGVGLLTQDESPKIPVISQSSSPRCKRFLARQSIRVDHLSFP